MTPKLDIDKVRDVLTLFFDAEERKPIYGELLKHGRWSETRAMHAALTAALKG